MRSRFRRNGPKDIIDKTKDCVDENHQFRCRNVNYNYVYTEVEFKLRENVKPMTILPDATTPVVAYLGTDEKGKRAALVIARDATMVDGSGACVPSPENCLYITLQKGETATLSFGPDGQTYELRLLAIRDVELKSE